MRFTLSLLLTLLGLSWPALADGLGASLPGADAGAPPARTQNGIGTPVPASRIEDMWPALGAAPRSRLRTPARVDITSGDLSPGRAYDESPAPNAYPNPIDPRARCLGQGPALPWPARFGTGPLIVPSGGPLPTRCR